MFENTLYRAQNFLVFYLGLLDGSCGQLLLSELCFEQKKNTNSKKTIPPPKLCRFPHRCADNFYKFFDQNPKKILNFDHL